MKPIDPKWIQGYVDDLLQIANKLPENSSLRDRIVLRAECILDMVTAWKERSR